MIKALRDWSVTSKVSTLNLIAFSYAFGQIVNSIFVVVWILSHSSRMTDETLRLVFDTMSQNKEILLIVIGFLARDYTSKGKNTNEEQH